jgi:hypothetical protein
MQKAQVKAELERMILNYRLMDVLEEKDANTLIGLIGGVIALQPAKGKIIPFPGVTLAPKPEALPPEPTGPKLSEVWNNLTTQGLKVNYQAMYAIYNLGGYDPEKIAAISAGEIIKHRGVGAVSIKKIRTFLQSKGLDLKSPEGNGCAV